MGQFLYFVETEGARGDIAPDAVRVLASVLGETGRMCIAEPDAAKHPSGKPGVIVRPDVANFPPERMCIVPAVQEWRRFREGVWVGMWLDWIPGPDDLRRREQLEGYDVRLEGGPTWLLPLLKFYTSRDVALAGRCALPAAVCFDVDGNSSTEPLRRHRALSADAERLWGTLMRAGEPGAFQEMLGITANIAPQALALNYRVTAAECSLLQIFTTTNLAMVAAALCDYDGFEEMAGQQQKKKPVMDASGPSS